MGVVVCCPVIVQSVQSRDLSVRFTTVVVLLQQTARWRHLSGGWPGFPALQTDVHTVQQQTEGSALATTVGYRL